MSDTVRFSAKLEPAEVGTYVVIPPEVVAALRATGRTSVTGTIDGHAFSNQVMPYTFEGVGRQVVMVVNKSVRTGLGKNAGDSVEFVLARDARSRSASVAVPAELEQALAANPSARAAFEAMPPSHRREHSEFVAGARREETRQRRAAQTIERLGDRKA
ncbi:MAG: YdeI/OmpD-associated family protein [Chloroflexota bacterium]|nr:YdeI/OmpD-associated family protein [Chloroflexota bacterium]